MYRELISLNKLKKDVYLMQFVIIAYDGKDKEAPKRRMAARDEHLAKLGVLKEEKKFIKGGAILDQDENMIGSVMIMDFPTKEEFDKYLEAEPYVVNKVWENIEVLPIRIPQIFMD
jgi:uncharacterized protein YciI